LSYAVKEIFKTLQGEGGQAGRAAVFCRFAGCNLWSGRESDRSAATCSFCDTDFVGTDGAGGGRFRTSEEIADAIADAWGPGTDRRMVVFTGGEPLLQLDAALIDAAHRRGFTVAIETNGTLEAPGGIDWVCVSPMKLVVPQEGAAPELFETLAFERFFLQPMDGPHLARNTALAVAYCLDHPRWRISLQTHKLMGIP
jgi:7-carboxy-7-deazaguanine synthase (Cx14CxxC type)